MLTKDDVRDIRERIGPHPAPVLSLYVDVNPAKPENARKGWVARAKNAIKDLEIPASVREQVVTLLEENRPHARTLALFAAEDEAFLHHYDLQVDLPIADLAHGRVEARWGDPYITPLLYALDEYERAGVLWMAEVRWRFYEVFLGEIEEKTEVFRDFTAEEWRELKRYDLAANLGRLAARMGSDRDHYKRRVEDWVHRYYKRLAHMLEHVVGELDIQRLVLLGPQPETAYFEQTLPRSLRNSVTARVSNVTDEDNASPGMVLDKVAPVLEAAEREQEEHLLDQIRSQPGVWGLGPTLEALQYGRVMVLVAPWELQARVWRCPDGWVGKTADAARELCPNDAPQEIALREIIADLTADFGSRLEFVRGQPERVLLDKYGGLAGLLRW
jgi:hypothetical protein